MVAEKIKEYLEILPRSVKLVAVSKTKPEYMITEAYNVGQRIFGENKVQDLALKYEHLPKDIQWHMIGHLQTNKVKYIAPFVSLIHAVDSLKLLKEINKQAKKNNRVISCLLQFHIADEDSKFGMDEMEVEALLESADFASFQNVQIAGVMGMATYTDDQEQIRSEFAHLKSYYQELRQKYFRNVDSFKEISMGMSGDYQIAIEEGSTMIRVGSAIFGARHY